VGTRLSPLQTPHRDQAIAADIAKLPERPRTGRAGDGLISISLLSRIVGDPALDVQAGIGAAERKYRHGKIMAELSESCLT
jgi:hypothetical protein